jgi:hypothetical protein
MKLNKKDLEILKDVNYDTNAYYMEDEYDYLSSEIDLEYITDLIDTHLIDNYLIVSGYNTRWNGRFEIKEGYVSSFENFLNRVNVDSMKISFNKEKRAIEVVGIHHDGRNVYYLRKPEWYNKYELISLNEMEYYELASLRGLNSKAKKAEVIELVEELIEDYDAA